MTTNVALQVTISVLFRLPALKNVFNENNGFNKNNHATANENNNLASK